MPRKWDPFEPWPDDDAGAGVVETKSRARVAVTLALALFLVALGAVVILMRAAHWFDGEHREPPPSEGQALPPYEPLSTGCHPMGGRPAWAPEGGGVVDSSKLTPWIPALGPGGSFVGCIPRELLFENVDGGRMLARLAELSGTGSAAHPPYPVFAPDGTLAGYFMTQFVPLDVAAHDPAFPSALLAAVHTPADLGLGDAH